MSAYSELSIRQININFILSFVAFCSAAPSGGYDYPSQKSVTTSYESPTWINKRFFIHSAPEEEGFDVHHHDISVGTPRKNYNVVFVKSPAEKQQNIKVRVTPAVNEEKTAVYVLSKKTDAPLLETYVQEPVTTTSKPEVAFIKYRTNEEAEHVQHQIQAEYDRLGGSSIASDEGVSAIKSVIGILDSLQQGGASGSVNAADSSSSAYLPPTESH
ncbi:uncharacterized protein LOC133321654 [Musca vetustissima]|uniref:uncharacterized protein LOC133321654 n=1 Tax=Musca vetustissima TaxID=27455 RepID=UPI002AB7A5F0|nr:uncharacterized protein LOC133321654 [Musca vetustissima]